MKRLLSFCVVLIFILVPVSFALSAETTFEGEFKIQSWSEWNFDKKFNDRTEKQFDG